jgi:hypothetical protein
MKPVEFFARSEIVVIGQDYEYADVDNPKGNIYGYSAFIIAEDEDGNRRASVQQFVARYEASVLPRAEKMAAALMARLVNMGKLPVDFAQWRKIDPCYGSSAYIADGVEARRCFEEMQEDAERAWV